MYRCLVVCIVLAACTAPADLPSRTWLSEVEFPTNDRVPDINMDTADVSQSSDAASLQGADTHRFEDVLDQVDDCGSYTCLPGTEPWIHLCPTESALSLSETDKVRAVARCGECSWLGLRFVGLAGFQAQAGLNVVESSQNTMIFGSTTVQHLASGVAYPILIQNHSAGAGQQAVLEMAYLPGHTRDWDRSIGWKFSNPVLVINDDRKKD